MEYYPNHILFEFALQAFRIDGRVLKIWFWKQDCMGYYGIRISRPTLLGHHNIPGYIMFVSSTMLAR
jgi:hypothetical protein